MKNVRVKMAGIGVLTVAVAMVAAQAGLIGFGVKEGEVKVRLAEAILGGNVPAYPNAKLYNAATPAARVAFVKAFLATAKAYSETASFKADYARHREGGKPEPPEAKGSAEQQLTGQQAEQRKKLEETKAEISKMPPEMQNQMKEMLKQMEAELNKQAGDSSQKAAMKEALEAEGREEQERYKQRMAEWSADFPEQPNSAIAKRLKEFLALTADIDFNARLEPINGGKMRFANPLYESKGSDWKVCYRAGREPVVAARAFVADWLHQLGEK
jgi:hypothetical protein